jgi:hypothetical protein
MSEETQDLSFARVLDVRAQSGLDNDELLAKAKKRALDPEVFTEAEPFFFTGEISSTRWDAYDTKMGVTTLKNFAEDAERGVAFLRNHDTRQDPLGHSLGGRFVSGSGNGVARVEADFYVLQDSDGAPYVRKIRSGVVRDLSVGFFGGEWICSLCNRDMMDWMSRDGCPHLLGFSYTPEKGGEPEKARATIENAHLAETSGVYDGATPGAMILKARSMAEHGMFDAPQRELVQVRYRLQLPDVPRNWPGADLEQRSNHMAEPTANGAAQEPVPAEQILARLRGHGMPEGEKDPAEWVTGQMQRLQQLRALEETLKGARDGEEKPADTLTRLCSLATLVGDHRAEGETHGACATRLASQAADGRTYRTHLIDAALTEGVRAHGNDFAKERYQKLLEGSDLDTIRQMQADWAKIAGEHLKGGRVTQDGEQREPVKQEPRAPIGAYAA